MNKILLAVLLAFSTVVCGQSFRDGKPLVGNGQSGNSLPATCTTAQLFFKSNAIAGSNIYGCTSPNTWTAQGSSFDPTAPGPIGGGTPAAITGTTITATTKFLGPAGTSTAPTYSYSSSSDLGWYFPDTGTVGFARNGDYGVLDAAGWRLRSNQVFGFSSSATAPFSNGNDGGISRLGAASLAIGNGTAGDFSGSLKLTTINVTGGPNNSVAQYGLNGTAGGIGRGTNGEPIVIDASSGNLITLGGNMLGINQGSSLTWRNGYGATGDLSLNRAGAGQVRISGDGIGLTTNSGILAGYGGASGQGMVDTTTAGLLWLGKTNAVGIQLAGGTALTLTAGAIGMPKMTASGTAPGATGAKEEWVCGTAAGSLKKIAYGGTSSTAVVMVDNVGSGATGC